MATTPEVGSAVEEIPSRNLPPVTYQDLPEALPLRKVLGPGMVSNGIGLSPGELLIWPYITSQVGLMFLWAVVIGVLTKFFLNMEIERYTLATGETAITGFSRFWKPWGIVFCLCTIISNAWPGVATSGATVLTFTLGFGNSMMIAMVSLVALAAAPTISPVVYRTLEKIEFFKVGAVIVFLNRAFAHYYAIPSDGGFGSSTVYRRMHYPSGGGPHLLSVCSSYLSSAVSRRKGTAALTVLLGATRFPPNKRRETARTVAYDDYCNFRDAPK